MPIITETPQNDTFLQSQTVACKIGAVAPDAVFCTFALQGSKKIPFKRSGQGVARDTDTNDLYTAEDIWSMDQAPHGQYLGLVQQRPIISASGNYLVCLDVDMKHASGPTNVAIQRMAKYVKANNMLTEVSVSGRGRHVFLWVSPPKESDQVLPKYKLGGGQEVEVFGLPNSAGKSVLLSGNAVAGEFQEAVDLHALLTEWGIIEQHQLQEPKPEAKAPPSQSFDFTQLGSRIEDSDLDRAVKALHHISPDCDYDQWIELGQALHTAFGDAGLGPWMQWSMAGQKFAGTKDIETHWKSFHQGKGVGLGTLYKHAKDHGWQPPTKQTERKSAVEDFGIKYMEQTESPKPEAPKTRWQPIPLNLNSLEPVDYLIDGFIAHSFSVIAGQPGVGKTTAMLSIALIAAGFKVGDSEIKAEARRKIIYVSEDTAQVKRSLYAYSKHMNISASELTDYFVLIESIRSTADEVIELAHNVIENTINNERPWVIIDTANATLDIENENDNSQVGAFMAALKQTIFTKLNTSICIITHTAKTMSKEDDSAMARGASAYTGDATLTAVLFMDEENNRYLRLIKTRYEPVFREVLLISQMHHEAVINRHGNMQDVNCIIVTPQISSAEDRKQAQAERINDTKQQRIQDKCDKAVNYVQSVINKHQQVIIRKGSHCPKFPPPELANHYMLEWSEIYQQVPGADRSDVKKAVGTAIFKTFNDTELANLWVQLT